MKIRVRGVDEALKFMGETKEDLVNATAELVQTTAKKYTPIKSGKARGSWNKSTSRRGFIVTNETPYIGRLEEGYSKQQPRGISTPTIAEIRRKTR